MCVLREKQRASAIERKNVGALLHLSLDLSNSSTPARHCGAHRDAKPVTKPRKAHVQGVLLCPE